jgi:hypothetical protein
MGEPNTTQVEGLDFVVHDHAAPAAEHIAKAFERVHHVSEGTIHKLEEITRHTAVAGLGLMGLGYGFHALSEKLSDNNLELENAAKKIAGVQFTFSGWAKGTSGQQKWAESLAEGKEVVDKLEVSESKLKMGRDELSSVYKSAFALGERHNLSQRQMIGVTEKLGAVQKVLGVGAEFASMQISRMVLSGKVRGFDDFSKTLRFAIGDMKAFAKLSEEKRFEKIQKAMGDIMPAAEGMGRGVQGSLFDIKKTFNDLTRDLSGPLFEEVTKELGQWAKKISEIRENGKGLAQEYGDKLVGVFHSLEKSTGFMAEHWKAIALIFASSKLGGALGVGMGGAGAGMGLGELLSGSKSRGSMGELLSDSRSFSTRLGVASGGLGAFTGKLLAAAPALTALYVAANAAADWMNSRHEANMAERAKLDLGAINALHGGAATAGYLQMTGLGGKGGVDKDAAVRAFAAMGDAERSRWAEKLDQKITKYVASGGVYGAGIGTMQTMLNTNPEALAEAFGKSVAYTLMRESPLFGHGLGVLTGDDMLGWGKGVGGGSKVARKADVNINVASLTITQDFKQADPDRIFHRIPGDIADMVMNPRGSNLASVPG